MCQFWSIVPYVTAIYVALISRNKPITPPSTSVLLLLSVCVFVKMMPKLVVEEYAGGSEQDFNIVFSMDSVWLGLMSLAQ